MQWGIGCEDGPRHRRKWPKFHMCMSAICSVHVASPHASTHLSASSGTAHMPLAVTPCLQAAPNCTCKRTHTVWIDMSSMHATRVSKQAHGNACSRTHASHGACWSCEACRWGVQLKCMRAATWSTPYTACHHVQHNMQQHKPCMHAMHACKGIMNPCSTPRLTELIPSTRQFHETGSSSPGAPPPCP